MLKVNDFSACITVDGKALEEFASEVDEETNTATCWIASEAGKVYEVHWENHRFRLPTTGRIYVDGCYCAGAVLSHAAEVRACRQGVNVTATTTAPFTFSSIQVSDDDSLLHEPMNPDFGLITIKVHNVQIIERNLPFVARTLPESRTYHEKTKKGMCHQTSFQKTIATPKPTTMRTKNLGEPVAIFNFRYRPLAFLQASEIAPRPPTQHTSISPPPSTLGPRKRIKLELDSDGEVIEEDIDDEDVEDQNSEDAKRLAELQKEMDAIRAKRKKDERPHKKIKREPIVGLTVDLTAED